MACCAFAVFLISQIYLGLDWITERLGLARDRGMPVHASSVWRLGDAPTPPTIRNPARRRIRRAGLAVGVGALAVLGLAAFAPRTPESTALLQICTSHGVAAVTGIIRYLRP